VNKPAKLDYQWTYYGGDELFSRVSAPVVFAATTAPPGKSGLCVELTCREGDERWQHPERHTATSFATSCVRAPSMPSRTSTRCTSSVCRSPTRLQS